MAPEFRATHFETPPRSSIDSSLVSKLNEPCLLKFHLLTLHVSKPATTAAVCEEIPLGICWRFRLHPADERNPGAGAQGVGRGLRRAAGQRDSAETAVLCRAAAVDCGGQGNLPVPDALDHDRHLARY